MNQFIIPLIIGFVGCCYVYFSDAPSRKRKKRITTFNEHCQEIRDLINRCDDKAEWSLLDLEIDYLEQTWCGKVDPAIMIKETGMLYAKWHQRGTLFNETKTA